MFAKPFHRVAHVSLHFCFSVCPVLIVLAGVAAASAGAYFTSCTRSATAC